MRTQTSALEIMRGWQHAKPGTVALFRSRDSINEFELRVSDHQATWFFDRRDYMRLWPDIKAAGVSFCVRD